MDPSTILTIRALTLVLQVASLGVMLAIYFRQ